MAIVPADKSVTVQNLDTGETFARPYDKLVIATGARAWVPPILGADGPQVFTLRNINDMLRIRGWMQDARPKTAAVIGTGFIGLEMCENLQARGIRVTLVEKLPQVTPGLDADVAAHVQNHLAQKGVSVITGATVAQITESAVALTDGRQIAADMVLLAAGVRPETGLAAAAGVALGVTGAIRVNERMQTNLPDVYACGDCIEHWHAVTGKPVWRPLGSTANKTGRIAGDSLTGGDLTFRGVLGTGIFGVFGLTVAQTGLTEREAREQGMDVVVCHNIKPDKPAYMHGREMIIKAIADRATGRVLGAQIVGFAGVDKRIDVLATAITFGATAGDLFHLDLAYAPPYSTTKDPVAYTGMILENALHRGRPLITAEALDARLAEGEKVQVIDARSAAQYAKSHLETAESIPLESLRAQAGQLDRDAVTVTYCNKGTTGNAAQNLLLGKGFRQVYNLSGGEKQYRALHRKP